MRALWISPKTSRCIIYFVHITLTRQSEIGATTGQYGCRTTSQTVKRARDNSQFWDVLKNVPPKHQG